MMKPQNRHFKDLLKIVPLIMIAASTFLLLPLPANGQTKSGSLLSRLGDRTARSLRVSFAYYPSFPIVGQTIHFSDTSSGSPVSWQWDFGDGTTSTDKNPTHVFTSPGFHRVTLAEADGQGAKKSSRLLTVVPAQGQATFGFSPTTPAPGQAVQFTDTTSGGPTAWSWNFGDGATSSVKNPSHVFGRAGDYIVNLVATTSTGAKQASKTVAVASISMLSSSFTFTPSTPLVNQAVQFTDTSTGSPTSWSWTFGDGTTSTAQNPTHAYTTAGTRTVSLTATNGSGSSSATRTVTVVASVTASFTFSPASPAINQAVQFTDTSTGSPTSWSWNFGDGTTSTAQNPSHAFATAGSKTVSLTATGASGSATATRTVTVAAAVTASFTFSHSPQLRTENWEQRTAIDG